MYRGTELWTEGVSPSIWGRYEKVICVGSLSKAFGLPGLRLGWLVAPPPMVEQVSSRKNVFILQHVQVTKDTPLVTNIFQHFTIYLSLELKAHTCKPAKRVICLLRQM